MGEALAKLAEEDPTFRQHTDQETGQTIIAGMGELHLDIIVDRLLREFKVEANVGAPQVAYKETITKAVDVDSKYAKQSGGRGQYGHCKVKFEPMDANGEELYKFESTVVGGAIPKEYIPAVGEGIEEAMKAGILGGFPVVGVYANVYDGSYHEVDSSEMAFHIAGSMAFKEAMRKAAEAEMLELAAAEEAKRAVEARKQAEKACMEALQAKEEAVRKAEEAARASEEIDIETKKKLEQLKKKMK